MGAFVAAFALATACTSGSGGVGRDAPHEDADAICIERALPSARPGSTLSAALWTMRASGSAWVSSCSFMLTADVGAATPSSASKKCPDGTYVALEPDNLTQLEQFDVDQRGNVSRSVVPAFAPLAVSDPCDEIPK